MVWAIRRRIRTTRIIRSFGGVFRVGVGVVV